jgi:predicted nucleic acid-binding protein
MLIDQVVVNASPLIILFKSQQSQLLPDLFREIIVPATVWDEVTTGSKQDIAAQQLPKADWVKRIEVAIAPEILVWSLDAGESTVLSFALQNPTYRAMVDDAAARRCARTLNIAALGECSCLPSVAD